MVENGLIKVFYCYYENGFMIGTTLLVTSHIHENTRNQNLCKKKVRRILNPILGTSKIIVICCNSSGNNDLSARSILPKAANERCSFTHFLYKN